MAKIRARDTCLTVFSNLGEIERFLMLYMVRDVAAIEKDGKGWDFSNTWTAQGAVPTWA
jgi:hypothetical protein